MGKNEYKNRKREKKHSSKELYYEYWAPGKKSWKRETGQARYWKVIKVKMNLNIIEFVLRLLHSDWNQIVGIFLALCLFFSSIIMLFDICSTSESLVWHVDNVISIKKRIEIGKTSEQKRCTLNK